MAQVGGFYWMILTLKYAFAGAMLIAFASYSTVNASLRLYILLGVHDISIIIIKRTVAL